MGHMLRGIGVMLLAILFTVLTLDISLAGASAIPILPQGCSRVQGTLYCPSDSAPNLYSGVSGLKATPVPQLGGHGFEPLKREDEAAISTSEEAPGFVTPTATSLDKREYDPTKVTGSIVCGVSPPVSFPDQADIDRFATDPFCTTLIENNIYLWAGRPWVAGHPNVDGVDFALFIELLDTSTSATISDWCSTLYTAIVQDCSTDAGFISGKWVTPELQVEIEVGPFTKRSAELASLEAPQSPRLVPRGLSKPVCNTNDLTLASYEISDLATNDFCKGTNLLELTSDSYFVYKDYAVNGVSLRVEAKLISSDQVWLEEGICNDAFKAMLNDCLPADLSGNEHGGSIIDNDHVVYSVSFMGPAKKARSTSEPPADSSGIEHGGRIIGLTDSVQHVATVTPPGVKARDVVGPPPVFDRTGKNSYGASFCDSGHPILSRDDIENQSTEHFCRDGARILQPHGEWFIEYEIDNVFVTVSATFEGDTGSVSLEEGACNRAFWTLFQQCAPADGSNLQDGGWILDTSDNIWYVVVTSSSARRARDAGTPVIDAPAHTSLNPPAGTGMPPAGANSSPPATPQSMPPAGPATPVPALNARDAALDTSEAHTLDARGNGYSTPSCAAPGQVVIAKSALDNYAVDDFCEQTNGVSLTSELGFVEFSYTITGVSVRVRATQLVKVGGQSWLEKGECERAIDHMLDTCNEGAGGSMAQYDIGYEVIVG